MSNRLAFQTQLASIMEVLANAAVAEICKLVDDDYAVVSLQMSQCHRENKSLKRKLHLLELKMARGNAERRLRESSTNSTRPRVQINCGDRRRESSPSTGGVLERQMDITLWSDRTATRNTVSQANHSGNIQSMSPDVELVEPDAMLVKEEKVEANMSCNKETVDVPLIGDDGVLKCVHRGVSGERLRLEEQDTQIQISRTRPTGKNCNNSRGVEKDDEPDVVLVKVEEVEPLSESQNRTDLSIQEGLVESSTDDYRGGLPFDDTTQASTNQLLGLQESEEGFSEVSYGRSSLWTNGGSRYFYDNSLPGPSSHCSPLPYLQGKLISAEAGSSVLAVENSSGILLSVESSRSVHASFEPQAPVIDLSDESSPIQALDHTQGVQLSIQVSQPCPDPGPSKGQGSYCITNMHQKIPRKRGCICRFCGKGFSSQANLHSHLRTHTGERPYGCTICGKKFSQFWNLKIHRNIHTGERPYQCPLCPERFSDPSNLKKHQKRHLPKT